LAAIGHLGQNMGQGSPNPVPGTPQLLSLSQLATSASSSVRPLFASASNHISVLACIVRALIRARTLFLWMRRPPTLDRLTDLISRLPYDTAASQSPRSPPS
jgi:hypothetical protein